MLQISKTPEKIKVLIVEGHNVRRLAWQNSLQEHVDLNVVGVADSINQAYYLIGSLAPEVVVIDLVHFGVNGLDAISKIRAFSENTKVIVLSSGEDKNEIISSFEAGANAYFLDNLSNESLALIIKTVAKGACLFDSNASMTVFSYLPKMKKDFENSDFLAPLSEREMQVLRLLVKGKSNTDIAHELIVSVHTAKAHVCSILHKMNVADRVQAAVKAVNYRMV